MKRQMSTILSVLLRGVLPCLHDTSISINRFTGDAFFNVIGTAQQELREPGISNVVHNIAHDFDHSSSFFLKAVISFSAFASASSASHLREVNLEGCFLIEKAMAVHTLCFSNDVT